MNQKRIPKMSKCEECKHLESKDDYGFDKQRTIYAVIDLEDGALHFADFSRTESEHRVNIDGSDTYSVVKFIEVTDE